MRKFHSGWRTIIGTAVAALALAATAGTAEAAPPATATVAAGYAHTCAVRTDHTLWCWGSNGSGQPGDGTTTNRTAPVQAGTATTWAGIDAGTSYNCAVRTDGTLWCWGSNTRGQL